jgi:hypothetical protein
VREAEESPPLQAVTSERLVKTQQVRKSLAGALLILELWKSAKALLSACSSEWCV